ncbi:MAG: Anthranilate phosphoribosyltransferase like (EC [uncultured Paraburkholderia sp.]|nr:MAG: Anthranilate phosphoribosyltransferase like (EC [uncultured Paraburkholderia sp.]CAH2944119.1 MAG: Anthranilate phosphoribosyltransferase like (EC [uncultured Paraburkholderia sp.]
MALPEACDAATTAAWIGTVMRGEVRVPSAIERQVELIARVVKAWLRRRPELRSEPGFEPRFSPLKRLSSTAHDLHADMAANSAAMPAGLTRCPPLS